MREVNMRMVHLSFDMARAGGIEQAALTEGLRSLTYPDGHEPDWVDWDDFVEMNERLERLAGGPEGLGRAMRAASPTAYAELRAFAAIFLRPIPLFTFVMTRMMPTMYRHLDVELERVGTDSVRYRQTIPLPYRASETFLRGTVSLIELFPLHLDMPEATVEVSSISARSADLLAHFPPPPPLEQRSARAVSAATSVLAAQFNDLFERITESLRGAKPARAAALLPAAADWPKKLGLSPRQREVFALLLEGRANKAIAGALRCSERNVEFHVGGILRAARVTSRAELLVKVLGVRK